MAVTPHLELPVMEAGQAQKHVTFNEALRALDGVVQLAVLDRDLTTPPGSPDEGDRYIVAADATGDWDGRDDTVALFGDGVWTFLPPQAGWIAFVVDEATLVYWTGTAWARMQDAITALQNLTGLGIGTAPDATNRLAVKSPAALLSAVYAADGGSGDAQLKLNKESAAGSAGLVLQTDFSGRAEIALAGDDDLHVKVSPDGSAWHSALVVDKDDGAVSFPLGAMRVQTDKFTASGTWTRPAWAKRVHVIAVAGGAGGGSGALRAAGVACAGGGGGASGAMIEAGFDAPGLPATVAVTVGTGGAGGAAQTVADGNGNAGAAGTATAFGSYLEADDDGAAPGSGGSAASGAAGNHATSRDYPGQRRDRRGRRDGDRRQLRRGGRAPVVGRGRRRRPQRGECGRQWRRGRVGSRGAEGACAGAGRHRPGRGGRGGRCQHAALSGRQQWRCRRRGRASRQWRGRRERCRARRRRRRRGRIAQRPAVGQGRRRRTRRAVGGFDGLGAAAPRGEASRLRRGGTRRSRRSRTGPGRATIRAARVSGR